MTERLFCVVHAHAVWACNLQAVYEDDRLREKEMGRFFGLTRKDIREMYPDDWQDSLKTRKYYFRMPGGENYCDVSMRVHSFMGTLSRSWAGKRVLIVSHHVPYVILRHLFDYLGESGILALPHSPNCAVQMWDCAPGGKMVRSRFNHVAYRNEDFAGTENIDVNALLTPHLDLATCPSELYRSPDVCAHVHPEVKTTDRYPDPPKSRL